MLASPAQAQRGGFRAGVAAGGFREAYAGYRGYGAGYRGYGIGYRGYYGGYRGYYGAYRDYRYPGYPYRYVPYGAALGWSAVGVPAYPYVSCYARYYVPSGGTTEFAPGSVSYTYNAASPSVSIGTPLGGDNVAPSFSTQPQDMPPEDEQPPVPNNTARLMLLVPENEQVWFDGQGTSETGKEREFVTPVLTPGKIYSYTIRVWGTTGDGRPIDQTRDIRVRANDWWSIDFTKPAPKVPAAGTSLAPPRETQGQ
jgi:uncharacterized protein (TIGR03000 family)